jgi:hypothetical protein
MGLWRGLRLQPQLEVEVPGIFGPVCKNQAFLLGGGGGKSVFHAKGLTTGAFGTSSVVLEIASGTNAPDTLETEFSGAWVWGFGWVRHVGESLLLPFCYYCIKVWIVFAFEVAGAIAKGCLRSEWTRRPGALVRGEETEEKWGVELSLIQFGIKSVYESLWDSNAPRTSRNKAMSYR